LINIPIPPVYLAEEGKNWEVIDGQQRLISLFRFYGPLKLGKLTFDELRLTRAGITILEDLRGKRYKDLSEELQASFDDYPIRVILIKKESDSDVKFDVFERLNTGAVNLNAQELRNCIYRGRFNDLINELAENKNFLFLLGLDKPHPRMQDKELVLRFFAFYHKTYLKYSPPMKRFLNKEMEDYRDLSPNEEKKLRNVFDKCVSLAKTVFGQYAFRRFIPGTEKILTANGRKDLTGPYMMF